jgi:hypothetical protein
MAKGVKTGGRKKGVRNKATAAKVAEVAASGLTPLDYMLGILRGQHPEGAEPAQVIAWEALRFEAAKAAAPYVHPKLANIEHTGKGGGPMESVTKIVREIVRPKNPNG